MVKEVKIMRNLVEKTKALLAELRELNSSGVKMILSESYPNRIAYGCSRNWLISNFSDWSLAKRGSKSYPAALEATVDGVGFYSLLSIEALDDLREKGLISDKEYNDIFIRDIREDN